MPIAAPSKVVDKTKKLVIGKLLNKNVALHPGEGVNVTLTDGTEYSAVTVKATPEGATLEVVAKLEDALSSDNSGKTINLEPVVTALPITKDSKTIVTLTGPNQEPFFEGEQRLIEKEFPYKHKYWQRNEAKVNKSMLARHYVMYVTEVASDNPKRKQRFMIAVYTRPDPKGRRTRIARYYTYFDSLQRMADSIVRKYKLYFTNVRYWEFADEAKAS